MGNTTGIEWTDSTWNPIRGCSRMSEGCRNCYAERTAAFRASGAGRPYEGLAIVQNGKPQWTGKIAFIEKHLLDPLKWKPVTEVDLVCPNSYLPLKLHGLNMKGCICKQRPRRIFVNSMSDLFHENVTDEMRDKIFAVMALCPQHTFQVLTKRPERMLEYVGATVIESYGIRRTHADRLTLMVGNNFPLGLERKLGPIVWPLPNVWLGVSVENQKAADERIPLLLQTPAAVRFISAEPLLGPVELKRYVWLENGVQSDLPWLMGRLYAPPGLYEAHRNPHGAVSVRIEKKMLGIKPDEMEGRDLDWVICGGESGPGARPMHPDWARGLRDQCVSAGVPFFFKQWGEYLPAMSDGGFDRSGAQVINASDEPVKVGKHAAGSCLDGQSWKQFPDSAQAGSALRGVEVSV